MPEEQIDINCPSMRKYPQGRTATGTTPKEGRTIACGPSFKGKWVSLLGLGKRKCEDRGGAIHDDRVDVYLDSYAEASTYENPTLTMIVL